jgi:hypothetical protein
VNFYVNDSVFRPWYEYSYLSLSAFYKLTLTYKISTYIFSCFTIRIFRLKWMVYKNETIRKIILILLELNHLENYNYFYYYKWKKKELWHNDSRSVNTIRLIIIIFFWVFFYVLDKFVKLIICIVELEM